MYFSFVSEYGCVFISEYNILMFFSVINVLTITMIRKLQSKSNMVRRQYLIEILIILIYYEYDFRVRVRSEYKQHVN